MTFIEFEGRRFEIFLICKFFIAMGKNSKSEASRKRPSKCQFRCFKNKTRIESMKKLSIKNGNKMYQDSGSCRHQLCINTQIFLILRLIKGKQIELVLANERVIESHCNLCVKNYPSLIHPEVSCVFVSMLSKSLRGQKKFLRLLKFKNLLQYPRAIIKEENFIILATKYCVFFF